MLKVIDGYLSRKAQAADPTSLVFRIEGAEDGQLRYELERKVDDEISTVCLGFHFGEAKASLLSFVQAEKAKRRTDR